MHLCRYRDARVSSGDNHCGAHPGQYWFGAGDGARLFRARSELGPGRRSQDDVRDAYMSISRLMRNWHRVFAFMDPGVVRNKDLAEIMRQIQLDGNEEGEFEEYDNMSD